MQHIMEMKCSFIALFIFLGLLMPGLAPSIFDQIDIYLFDRLIKGKKNFAGSAKNFLIACPRFPGWHLLLALEVNPGADQSHGAHLAGEI
jgi:hypothetical protein